MTILFLKMINDLFIFFAIYIWYRWCSLIWLINFNLKLFSFIFFSAEDMHWICKKRSISIVYYNLKWPLETYYTYNSQNIQNNIKNIETTEKKLIYIYINILKRFSNDARYFRIRILSICHLCFIVTDPNWSPGIPSKTSHPKQEI